MIEQTYSKDFIYTHKNPYHDRLGDFEHFVLRDSDGEKFRGNWNNSVFKEMAPLCLEIGSGYGHFMLEYCQRFPHHNFVGLDYRFKRSFQLATRLNQANLKNFRYLRAKGERINFLFQANELNQIFYFFPDPWPKTRHLKKRLFQTHFLENAYNVLAPGGQIYIKTDHDGYAEQIFNVISKSTQFNLKFVSWDLWTEETTENCGLFLKSFQTKFEKIFIKQEIKIKGFVIESNKTLSPNISQ